MLRGLFDLPDNTVIAPKSVVEPVVQWFSSLQLRSPQAGRLIEDVARLMLLDTSSAAIETLIPYLHAPDDAVRAVAYPAVCESRKANARVACIAQAFGDSSPAVRQSIYRFVLASNTDIGAALPQSHETDPELLRLQVEVIATSQAAEAAERLRRIASNATVPDDIRSLALSRTEVSAADSGHVFAPDPEAAPKTYALQEKRRLLAGLRSGTVVEVKQLSQAILDDVSAPDYRTEAAILGLLERPDAWSRRILIDQLQRHPLAAEMRARIMRSLGDRPTRSGIMALRRSVLEGNEREAALAIEILAQQRDRRALLSEIATHAGLRESRRFAALKTLYEIDPAHAVDLIRLSTNQQTQGDMAFGRLTR
jgi:hypothetical protein